MLLQSPDLQDVELQDFGSSDSSTSEFSILNECKAINTILIQLIGVKQPRLAALHRQRLDETRAADGPLSNQMLWRSIDEQILARYRELTDRVSRMATIPETGSNLNRAQFLATRARLRESLEQYQQTRHLQEREIRLRVRRNLRIVNPDLSEREVNAFIESGDTTVFASQIQNMSRMGEARAALASVSARSQDIRKISQDIQELLKLQTQLISLVIAQEPLLEQIQRANQDVVQNTTKGNGMLRKAIGRARAARKMRWFCLFFWISVLVILAASVGIWCKVTNVCKAVFE